MPQAGEFSPLGQGLSGMQLNLDQPGVESAAQSDRSQGPRSVYRSIHFPGSDTPSARTVAPRSVIISRA